MRATRCTEPSPISPACPFTSGSWATSCRNCGPQPLTGALKVEQHTHFAVIELERRHGASREARAKRRSQAKPRGCGRGAALVFAHLVSDLARRQGVRPKLARRPGRGSDPRAGGGMSPPKAWQGWPEHNPIARTNAPAVSPINTETSTRNSPLPLTMERFPPRPVSVKRINATQKS